MFRKRYYSGAGACAALVSVAVMAPGLSLAQQQDQGSAAVRHAELESVVVTAQRREQSLQDVPISVTVADADVMRESQVTNLNDLGNRLSGVKVNGAGASDSLNIRGVGSGVNMGFEQAVATFVDGVYLSRSQVSRGGFLDLERIEVLKGPQSTYFGSNAIAGALSIVTRKPSQQFDGHASVLYGSDGEYEVQAAAGGPMTESLSARAAVRFFGMDGYIDNLRENTTGPNGSNVQGRVALRYEKPDSLDVNLRVDYAKYDDEHAELQETVNCPPAPGYGNPSAACLGLIAEGKHDNKLDYVTTTGDSGFELESFNTALTAAWSFGDHTLTSTTGHYSHDLFRHTVGGALLPFPTLDVPSGMPLSQPEKYTSFSQELRLQSDSGGLIDYMAGVYYDDSNLEGGINVGFYFAPFWLNARPAGVIEANTPIAQEVWADQDQSNRSAFAAITLNLDSFRINAGARYSSIRKEAHRGTRAGFGDGLGQVAQDFTPEQFAAWTGSVGRPAGDYPITDRTDDKFMPSINVQYYTASGAMIYASYSTGFKAGGWSIGQGLDVFGPETVKSYELGLKTGWFGDRLTTNVTLFNSDYNDLQEATSIIDPETGIYQSIIGNVGKARSRGVDLEIGVRPFRGFNVLANIGYLDAEYREYPNAPCTLLQMQTPLAPGVTSCTQDLAGSRKAYAPEWSGSVNANYAFDVLSNLQVKLGTWLYFTSGYYQQASIDPLLYQSGYEKIDLRAAIGNAGESWELAVIAKNVTDKATGSYRAAMPGSNAVSVRMDRPRSLGVQFSVKF